MSWKEAGAVIVIGPSNWFRRFLSHLTTLFQALHSYSVELKDYFEWQIGNNPNGQRL